MPPKHFWKKFAGTFDVSPDHHIFGQLSIGRSRVRLRLNSLEPFPTHLSPEQCITGTLNNLTKVSLIHCVIPRVPNHTSGPTGAYWYATALPHYVVLGEQHIRPSDAVITSATLFLDDATILFANFEAFGSVMFDAEPILLKIFENEPHRKSRTVGPHPRILYYSGETNVASAETAFGRIVIERRPQFSAGGKREGGILRDRIAVCLHFDSNRQFMGALRDAGYVIDYLGLLIGRPQVVEKFFVKCEGGSSSGTSLEVQWVYHGGRPSQNSAVKPSSHDVLLDGVRHPEEFSSVTANWFGRHEAWLDSRWRFFNSCSKQRLYDVDRLIAAANMFDVLPDSAVAVENVLSPELAAAQETCRGIFRELPTSAERDSVLSALGRLSKNSLKQKVRHRARLVVNEGGSLFNDLITVVDQAVNCRNFYVHGSRRVFEYEQHFDSVVFFTETLEFIFAVSDLIECGWNFRRWVGHGTSMSHPFGRYMVNYSHSVSALLALLPTTGDS